MDAHAHSQASGSDLNRLAFSATTHCLTGCAIGEFAGMAIATAFGWGNGTQTALAIFLAYCFGFGLTAMPLVRAGLPTRKVPHLLPHAFFAPCYRLPRKHKTPPEPEFSLARPTGFEPVTFGFVAR